MCKLARSIIEERRFSKLIPGNLLLLLLKLRSMILDGNDGNSDDVKVEGTMMAMRLPGNFGRYGVQPFCISYETGNDDNNNNNNDNDYNTTMWRRWTAC